MPRRIAPRFLPERGLSAVFDSFRNRHEENWTLMYRRKMNRRPAPRQIPFPALALPLLAFPFALIVAGGALAQETKSETPAKSDAPAKTDGKTDSPDAAGKDSNAPEQTKTDAARVDTSGPPPANPLVLRDPDNGSGNSSKNFDDKGNRRTPAVRSVTDFGDWRRNSGDPRDRDRAKNELPLFGYNFFAPAREYLQARRDALLRRLNPENDFIGATDGRTSGNSAPLPRYAQTQSGQQPNSPYDAAPTGTRRVAPGDNAAYYGPLNHSGNAGSDGSNGSNGNGGAVRSPQRNADGTMTTQDGAGGNSLDGSMDRNSGANRIPRQVRGAGIPDAYGNGTDGRGANSGSYAPRRNAPYGSGPYASSNYSDQNYGGYGNRPYGYDPNYDYGYPSRNSRNNYQDNGPFDAYNGIADPLTQLYNNVQSSVPASYAISGGDSLTVSYSAPTLPEQEFTGKVDALGSLNLQGGRIVLRGMTLEQATAAIKSRLARLYKNVSVIVQLRELRTIAITVSGEAVQPGSYTVPAVATALNVLTAAGGPNENGTLRRIEVRRAGKLAGTVDIYQFLTGGVQPDISLQSGDLIVIPPRQSRVVIQGEVRNPAQFELLDNETLADALKFAGGVKSSGVAQSVQINTVQPGQERILKNVDIKSGSGAAKTALYDGDTVDVFSVRATLANLVSVEGAVVQPSDYALSGNMRVADLIERARGVLPEASLNRADLYRWNPDNTTSLITVDVEKALANDPKENFTLNKWDRLKIYSREEVVYTGLRKMTVRGAARKPGVYARSENTRVADLLLRSGGPAPDAYLERAELLHQRGDGTFAYEQINLAAAIAGDPKNNVLIEDNDLLAIYNVGEANFTPEHVVSVLGEVVAPGIYPRGAGMKLSEVVQLAGGFRPGSGGTVRLTHARRSVDANQSSAITVAVNFDRRGHCAADADRVVEDGDVVTVQGDGAFQNDVRTISIVGAVRSPGPLPIVKKGMRLTEALALAGGLRPEAFAEGAEFYRNPAILASTGQKTIVQSISAQIDALNASQLKRFEAISAVDLAKAAGSASETGGGLSALSSGGAAAQSAAGAAVAQQQLGTKSLTTPARQFRENDLTPQGNIAVNLPDALKKPGGFEDILLEDGDRIIIPETPTTVQVVGAVYHSSGVQFTPAQSMDYYIQHAGGYASDAARNRILIIRRGGGVLPAGKAGQIRPGDLIFIPTRVQAEKIGGKSGAFNDIFKTVTNTALTAFLATRLFGL